MIPPHIPPHSQSSPYSSFSAAGPSSAAPAPPTQDLNGTFSVTLSAEAGLPPEASTFIVPPRLTDTTTDTNMTDTPIRCASCVLDALRQHPKHFTFTASSDKEGGRQIQCTTKRKDGRPGRSIITLHIDGGNRLRELTMERSQEGGQKTRHFARFQQNLPPAATLRTRAPVWLIASRTDGSTGSSSSSRKRRIAPPPAPDAARPRSDSDGNIDLRLAPLEDEPDLSLRLAPPEVGFDTRQALLDEMGDLAKRRAGQQSGKP